MHLAAAGLDVRHPAELVEEALSWTGAERSSTSCGRSRSSCATSPTTACARRPTATTAAKADEKRLLQARRAIEKAIRALDTTDLTADDGP